MIRAIRRLTLVGAFMLTTSAGYVAIFATPAHAVKGECVNAVDDSATTPQGVAVDVSVLDNDSTTCSIIESAKAASASDLFVDSTTDPSNGTASVNAGDLTVKYTPNAGFSGTDTFTYSACSDTFEECEDATVTVTVDPAPTTTTSTTAPPVTVLAATVTAAPAELAATGAETSSMIPLAATTLAFGGTLIGIGRLRLRRRK